MFRRLAYILPVLTALAIGLAGWAWVRGYTRHGVALAVPDVKGRTVAEAEALLRPLELTAEVIDSVHNEEAVKGAVVEQDPRAGSQVKPGRSIYLVVNALQPAMLDMPALVDLSKRQAISVLDIVGLKVAELRYKPDACTDCVVQQLYRGAPIATGTGIRKGEAITLVLGSGESGERVPVPDLTGLTFAEVSTVVNMASLNLGAVLECAGCNSKADSSFARVYRQAPGAGMIAMGGLIDIWLTADTAGLRPAAVDSLSDPNAIEDADDAP
ncbi:MAG: PASTA domain-containing protein [Flavobacteriales bacterium]|nr:PASTA domain-containing protein [Flavobacteriales bacterium]